MECVNCNKHIIETSHIYNGNVLCSQSCLNEYKQKVNNKPIRPPNRTDQSDIKIEYLVKQREKYGVSRAAVEKDAGFGTGYLYCAEKGIIKNLDPKKLIAWQSSLQKLCENKTSSAKEKAVKHKPAKQAKAHTAQMLPVSDAKLSEEQAVLLLEQAIRGIVQNSIDNIEKIIKRTILDVVSTSNDVLALKKGRDSNG